MEQSPQAHHDTPQHDSAAPQNIYQKLGVIMEQIGNLEKTGKAPGLNYSFFEFYSLAPKVRELLIAHRLIIIPGITECVQDVRTTVKGGTMYHSLAHTTFTIVNTDNPAEQIVSSWAGEADDTSDKGLNKAGTAAEKYFLMKLFLISDRDDPDGHNPVQQADAHNAVQPTNAQNPNGETPFVALSEAQLKAVFGSGKGAGLSNEQIVARTKARFKYAPKDLSKDEASHMIEEFKGMAAAPAPTTATPFVR